MTEQPGGPVLAGCVIAVTADRRFKELAGALERRGASVEHARPSRSCPTSTTRAWSSAPVRSSPSPPDVVVATTGIGFRGWIEAADAVGLAEDLLDVLGRARLIARGPKARGAIEAAGLTADWVATSETAAEIQQFLLAEGVSGLADRGAAPRQWRRRARRGLRRGRRHRLQRRRLQLGALRPGRARVRPCERTADGLLDAVVFTSAPGVHAWLDAASGDDLVAIRRLNLAGRLVLATVGPVTAAPLEDAGLVTLVPARWRLGPSSASS